MGWFFAIDIPDNIVKTLDEFTAYGGGLRKQRRDDLHVTLTYFKKASDAQIEQLVKAVADIEVPKFDISGEGVHYFPPSDDGYRTHFFTAKMDCPQPLTDLKMQIDAICKDMGLDLARTHDTYSPHITLYRSENHVLAQDVQRFQDENKARITPAFDVGEFALYQSDYPNPYKKYTIFGLK